MNKDLLNILSNSNKDIDNQQLMDYLSGKLSGDELLNDAVEGLQKMRNKKDMQTYVDDLNASMQKSLQKKKNRRLRRRIKDDPWTYLAIVLVIVLCVLAFYVIRQVLIKH